MKLDAAQWPEDSWAGLAELLIDGDDLVLLLDDEFRIVRANPAFQAAICSDLSVGAVAFEASLSADSREVFRAFRASGELQTRPVELQHALEAGVRTVSYRFRRLSSGWLCVGKDLSDQLEIVGQMSVLVGELESRVTEERALSASLRALAERDPLTGLANRRSFESDLDGCRSRYGSAGLKFALLCLDVDCYKQVNDRYGHAVGDRVLIEVARAVERSIREGDVAARLGGDEFVVIACHVDQRIAMVVAERIRRNVEALEFAEVEGGVTVSIGVATTHSETTSDAGGILRRADKALYSAKKAGRNCVRLAPS